MKIRNQIGYLFCWLLAILLALPPGLFAQSSTQDTTSPTYSKEQLTQMLAPIALYPDALLSQMLMAATYPLEVVEADRWVKQNPSLKGDQLDQALLNKSWDVSVKSMAHFPDILAQMSKNLEQTQKLGDAFLGQQDQVMDTIQELRNKAYAQGNLKTTKEQKVIVEQQYITIAPSDPQVVYVPAYNPAVVYGVWAYPAYPPPPPYYYYPYAPVAGAALAFGAGLVVGAAITGWCGFGWGSHNVTVNNFNTNNFNRNNLNNINRGNQNWQHNPEHRQGVAYQNKATAQKYGQSPARSAQGKQDMRGYQDRSPGTASRDAGKGPGGQRPDTGRPGGGQPDMGRSGGSQMDRSSPSTRDNALSGAGSGRQDQMASSRGQASRQSSFGGGGGGSRGPSPSMGSSRPSSSGMGGGGGGMRGGGGGRGGRR
jgi:hypothetical protein